ncbi:DUF881 domain-containing protein [Janibacter melonis]|uniref:DUF881 domain-containing protein n=1 Tax=Janibacter melonis TaxID=262209 RepID=UPI001E441044|nr:DUF881 domain-containing protein [Janibacter melonis]
MPPKTPRAPRTPPPGPEGSRRPDASMTLITSMLERPLDPGYQAAADARAAEGLPPSTGWRTPVLVVYLLIIGLVVGIAAADLRSRETTRTQTRAELVERIQARQEVVDERTRTARALQAEVDAATTSVDPDLVQQRTAQVERLRVADGGVAVTGPGLRVVVDDAEGTGADGDGDARSQTSDDGRVQSRDLQVLVNALWASGAEAVAVNGQRLTSRSAIRFAGDAILVNFRPLTRPYTIEAVGDPQAMQSRFAAGPGGAYLTGLQQNFGIATSSGTVDSMTLPSVVSTTLRNARPATGGQSTKETP